MSFVTITTAPSLIVKTNSKRISLIITRKSGSDLYLERNNTFTTATGITIRANGSLTEDSGARQMYLGDYYGVVGSTNSVTLDVRYWEREQ